MLARSCSQQQRAPLTDLSNATTTAQDKKLAKAGLAVGPAGGGQENAAPQQPVPVITPKKRRLEAEQPFGSPAPLQHILQQQAASPAPSLRSALEAASPSSSGPGISSLAERLYDVETLSTTLESLAGIGGTKVEATDSPAHPKGDDEEKEKQAAAAEEKEKEEEKEEEKEKENDAFHAAVAQSRASATNLLLRSVREGAPDAALSPTGRQLHKYRSLNASYCEEDVINPNRELFEMPTKPPRPLGDQGEASADGGAPLVPLSDLSFLRDQLDKWRQKYTRQPQSQQQQQQPK